MNKTIFLTLILALFFAACSGSAELAPSTDNSASNPSEAAPSSENGESFDIGSRELPLSSALAIGTLKLEDSDLAVASDQAAELLPLWQVLNNLSASDTAAPEEITAITEQIQETMTEEQLSAIYNMGLTGEDIFATMQELGLVNAPQVNAEGTPQPGSGFGGRQGPGGELPGAGPGGGGPGGNLGSEISPEQLATAQARRAEDGGGFGNRLQTPLIEAVIDLLQSKAQ